MEMSRMILLNGTPATVLPKGQKRKHKKKRINKKWLKRYGVGSGSHIEDGQILVINEGPNKRLIMNSVTWKKIKPLLKDGQYIEYY